MKNFMALICWNQNNSITKKYCKTVALIREPVEGIKSYAVKSLETQVSLIIN